jgi:tRNA(Ile)-lysidine synthase
VLSRVLHTIAEHQLLSPGDRILVAVSGGPDSSALLHALMRLGPRLGCGLEAAVVDHGLRPESAAEAAAVAAACTALGVGCEILLVDVRAARTPHVSWQDAARRARLAALAAWAASRGCTRVALGHTADDQAETLLFRIVRGTGLAGLAGIPYRRDMFVRPLLDVRRSEVLAFLRRRGVSFFEDPSNRDRRFARSRIRHEWLPLLAAENPRVVEALLALAAEARAAGPLPAAAATASALPRLGRRAAQTVSRLAARAAGTQHVSVPGGQVEVRYGHVSFLASAPPEPSPLPAAPPIEVTAPGSYAWPGRGPTALCLELRAVDAAPGPEPGAATFASECLAAGLILRSALPGERMRPRGGQGSRKLSDLLVDAKIPRPTRVSLPVLATTSGTILFVPGLRPAQDHRPPPGARSWLEIKVGYS